MKRIRMFMAAFAALTITTIAQPVLANDAPAGGAQGPTSTQAAPATNNSNDAVTWVLLAILAAGTILVLITTLRQPVLKQDKQREERASGYARDLARISSTLLVSLIALMTFLLVVGVQNSIRGFTTELYTSLVLLGLGLIIYALLNAVRETALSGGTKSLKVLNCFRRLQQLVFAGSVFAVVWFVISYAQLVIKPVTSQSENAQQQSQPAGQQPEQSAQPPEQQQPSQQPQPQPPQPQ